MNPMRNDFEGLSPEEAALVARALAEPDAQVGWRILSKELLRPEHPHELHLQLHQRCFASWRNGPAPAWVPSKAEITASNLGKVMRGDYRAFHRRSIDEPEAYWSEMLERLGIVVHRPAERVLDASGGVERARWFPGMQLNIAESALARADRPAVIFRREEGGPLERRSLAELRRDAAGVAAALRSAGFSPGDAIAIDLPMTYASVAIYLGIVMFGGAVVAIADSFAAPEIATRLRISGAKAIFTQDVIPRGGKILPLYARVIEAKAPRAVVVPAGTELALDLREGDVAWEDFLTASSAETFHVSDAETTTNILFSSGTTGDPKAIPWTQLTPIKAAADAWGHHDVRPGDVLAWPTNLGWMMGPWLIYAALLNDAAMALYYQSPLERGFGAFVQDARVTMLGVVPSLVKAWRASGCVDGLDWSAIRCFSSTGEASTPDEMHWLMARAGYQPVIEYCGGTEIGGGYISGTVVQPQAPATFSTPALGCDFVLIDIEENKGELALLPPMLGSSNRLLNADHHRVYFEGMPPGPRGEVLRRHGDEMEHLGNGYYRAHGRVDDTMNLGGIKTSSAEIERVCNAVEGVHETAAIAVEPPGGGPSRLVVYAVLTQPATPEALRATFQKAIVASLNPLFKVHDVVVVDALPRTASNKVMRRVLRKQYHS